MKWNSPNKKPKTNNPIILIDTMLNAEDKQIRFLRLTRRDELTETDWSKVVYWKYVGKLPKGVLNETDTYEC